MMAKRLACDKQVALWVCCVFSDGELSYVVDKFKPCRRCVADDIVSW